MGKKGNCSMYPKLHHEVERLLKQHILENTVRDDSDKEEDTKTLLKKHNLHYAFHTAGDKDKPIKEFDTNITGLFMCHNSNCNKGAW